MNRHSLFFTLTASFIISLFFVALSYYLLLEELNKRSHFENIKKYQPIMRLIRKEKNIQDASRTLTSFGYEVIKDKHLIKKITSKKHVVFLHKGSPKHKKNPLKIFRYEDKNFLKVKKEGQIFLIKDVVNGQTNFKLYLHVAFFVLLLVLVLSFVVTLRKLYPLKTLQQKIKHLGNEQFDNSLETTRKKDEVSLLWNEFVKSTNSLDAIKKARNVFLRNIFHELKTPITKGKFLLELENSQENSAQLKNIFTRLNALINDFAAIEEASSTMQNIQKQSYYIADIIDNVHDMLLLDDKSLHVKIDNQKINVNFKFFSIALKNLVDNALKYSPQHKATIYNEKENIIVKNIGVKLSKNIEIYRQPYKSAKRAKHDSLGLGIHIIFNLLEANGYTLEYLHVDGANYFTCKKID